MLGRYTEPHRAYHGVKHIEHCLDQFDGLRKLAKRPELVELALWLHDAVYDLRASDNEAKSADLSRRLLEEAGVPSLADVITDMIMATTHQDVPPVGDAALVSDIDLSILGADPDEYDLYTAEVRQEYSWVPEEAFRSGRLKVLHSFCKRTRIFDHPPCFDRWERRARANINHEMVKLSM
ncbi:hypothetical protein JEU22_00210 [Pseudomonas putida]|uniref:Phosphohydrolase n=1 Tax=Pseudomonas putida TaxID=303 RepID=A0A8I1JHW9_PSEPU|nr:hypothetical protein [Pseudomonas putida]